MHWPVCKCRVRPPKTVLLYGPAGSGKSLLSNAVAYQAGATMFDLSPAATDGKYRGKQAALMVHMVSWGSLAGHPMQQLCCRVATMIAGPAVATWPLLLAGDGLALLACLSSAGWRRLAKVTLATCGTFNDGFMWHVLPTLLGQSALLDGP
jgi:hypothetical protein